VSGQLWDFWGAGPIGVALGAEYRKEYTEGTGRSRSLGTTYAQLNSGADFLPASYETKEAFAELSIPLMRDSFLGEYAELSGSYRYSDFSTFASASTFQSFMGSRNSSGFSVFQRFQVVLDTSKNSYICLSVHPLTQRVRTCFRFILSYSLGLPILTPEAASSGAALVFVLVFDSCLFAIAHFVYDRADCLLFFFSLAVHQFL
jgi:hypothetical protein